MPEMVLPSARPASRLVATPITLPISELRRQLLGKIGRKHFGLGELVVSELLPAGGDILLRRFLALLRELLDELYDVAVSELAARSFRRPGKQDGGLYGAHGVEPDLVLGLHRSHYILLDLLFKCHDSIVCRSACYFEGSMTL